MAKQLTNFVKLVAAYITGDDAKVQSLKIQKKAIANLKSQIAVRDAHTLSLEDDLENAHEDLNKARANAGKSITNGEEYISELLTCGDNLDHVKSRIIIHKDIIIFIKDQLDLVQA